MLLLQSRLSDRRHCTGQFLPSLPLMLVLLSLPCKLAATASATYASYDAPAEPAF